MCVEILYVRATLASPMTYSLAWSIIFFRLLVYMVSTMGRTASMCSSRPCMLLWGDSVVPSSCWCSNNIKLVCTVRAELPLSVICLFGRHRRVVACSRWILHVKISVPHEVNQRSSNRWCHCAEYIIEDREERHSHVSALPHSYHNSV